MTSVVVAGRAVLDALGYGDRLAAVSLDPPLHEALACWAPLDFGMKRALRAVERRDGSVGGANRGSSERPEVW